MTNLACFFFQFSCQNGHFQWKASRLQANQNGLFPSTVISFQLLNGAYGNSINLLKLHKWCLTAFKELPVSIYLGDWREDERTVWLDLQWVYDIIEQKNLAWHEENLQKVTHLLEKKGLRAIHKSFPPRYFTKLYFFIKCYSLIRKLCSRYNMKCDSKKPSITKEFGKI